MGSDGAQPIEVLYVGLSLVAHRPVRDPLLGLRARCGAFGAVRSNDQLAVFTPGVSELVDVGIAAPACW